MPLMFTLPLPPLLPRAMLMLALPMLSPMHLIAPCFAAAAMYFFSPRHAHDAAFDLLPCLMLLAATPPARHAARAMPCLYAAMLR